MPTYLFWGDEDYNIELRVNELKKKVLNNDVTPLNYKKIENPNFNKLDEILRCQATMFGNILYVVLANKIFLNTGGSSYYTEGEVDEIIKSIENVQDSVHVVFVCNIEANTGKKPDSRKRLYKAIAKFGTVESFEMFKPWEDYKAIPYVQKRAEKLKIKIDKSVASKLVEMTGMSLRDLNNNLEKLFLLAYPRNIITEEMVMGVCEDVNDMHKITNTILKKDYTGAISKIVNILDKTHFLLILAFLQTAFTKLLQLKIYQDDYPVSELSRLIGQHEFVVKQNIQKIKNVTKDELIRLKQNLTNIEYKLKTGEIQDPVLAFELALNGGHLE